MTTPTTLMPYEIRALERAAYTLYLSMDAWRYMAVARTMREHHLKSFRVSVRALLHAVDVFALKLLFRFHFFPFLPLSAPVFASFMLFYIFFFSFLSGHVSECVSAGEHDWVLPSFRKWFFDDDGYRLFVVTVDWLCKWRFGRWAPLIPPKIVAHRRGVEWRSERKKKLYK